MTMVRFERVKTLSAIFLSLSLAACGGGGGDDGGGNGGGNTNRAPTADAGLDQSVNEFDTVTLDGSASNDPDAGDTLTYSWTQTAGTTVTLSDATVQMPTFDAPDVTAVTVAETLTFAHNVPEVF